MFDFVHKHMGEGGFSVSLFLTPEPGATLAGPIEMGKIHDQHMSEIGFINLP